MNPRSVERRRWGHLDPSPTGNRRRLTEEEPMSNKTKAALFAAAVLIVGSVAVGGLSVLAGRKWG